MLQKQCKNNTKRATVANKNHALYRTKPDLLKLSVKHASHTVVSKGKINQKVH
jgi:hypothetical protein